LVIASNGVLTNATGSTGTLSAKIVGFGTGTVNLAPYSLNSAADAANEFPGITLWLDAADSATITTSGGDVSTWANKMDTTVKMYPGWASNTGAPSNDGSINGKTAIKFAGNEWLQAKKNSSSGNAWNPLGVNGATNSNYNDFAVYLVVNFTNAQWNGGPFNFGWQGHIPGAHNSGYLFWDYPNHGDTRVQSNININTPYVITFYGSTTDSKRILGINGAELSGTPSQDTLTGGFYLPFSAGSQTALIAEMMVVKGTTTDAVRYKAEGYLAHKWGISLPSSHTWAAGSPYVDIQSGADVSLYWGSSDGGTDSGAWENTVSIGKKANQLALWLDASDLSSAGSTWSDKSGNANHATKNGSPTLVTNAANGHGVMRYSGANADYHEWTDITDIRTIFWVIRANPNNAGFLLGDDDTYHLHNSSGTASANIWASYASSNVINGNLAINGTREINGQTTALNSSLSSLSILSLKTSGNVEASRFSRDRNIGGRNWNGDLAELVIFNNELSDSDIEKIEGYLAHKWGLAGTLPASHPFKQSATMQGPKDLNSYTTDLSNLVDGNTYYYRVAATNSEGTDWADQTASFVSKSKIDLSSGSLSFNTSGPTPSWSASDGTGGNGVLQTLSWTDSQSNTIQYKVAKFSFDSVNIGDGVTVTLFGHNPIQPRHYRGCHHQCRA
jgi:hypothetical protein